MAVAMKHCSEPMPDPRLLAPGVPDWLAACALRAAAKEPGRPLPATPTGWSRRWRAATAGTAVMPAAAGRRPTTTSDTARRRRPRRRRWRGAAIALVVAAGRRRGCGAFLLLPGDDAPPPAAASVPAHHLRRARLRPAGRRPGREPGPARLRGRRRPRPTAWYTERYRETPDFGGLKTGVGLILRLTAPAVATEMVVTSPTPGRGFQVLGPLARGPAPGARQRHVHRPPTRSSPLTAAGPRPCTCSGSPRSCPTARAATGPGVGQVELRGVAELHMTMAAPGTRASSDLGGGSPPRAAAAGGCRRARGRPTSRTPGGSPGGSRTRGLAGPEEVSASALEAAFRGLGWSPATRARAVTALREWLAPAPPARALARRPHRPAAPGAAAGAAPLAGRRRRPGRGRRRRRRRPTTDGRPRPARCATGPWSRCSTGAACAARRPATWCWPGSTSSTTRCGWWARAARPAPCR